MLLTGGGRNMADYRLYCLSGNGRIDLADWVEANSDGEAIEKVRELKPDAHRCEIWLKDRLVARLNPDGRFQRVDASTN